MSPLTWDTKPTIITLTPSATTLYVEEHKGDQPFFRTAYTAPHWPMHAAKSPAYKGFYDKGWAPAQGTVCAPAEDGRSIRNGKFSAHGKATSWTDTKNKRELRLMETYAAMVTNMDAGMGRVDALKDRPI